MTCRIKCFSWQKDILKNQNKKLKVLINGTYLQICVFVAGTFCFHENQDERYQIQRHVPRDGRLIGWWVSVYTPCITLATASYARRLEKHWVSYWWSWSMRFKTWGLRLTLWVPLNDMGEKKDLNIHLDQISTYLQI